MSTGESKVDDSVSGAYFLCLMLFTCGNLPFLKFFWEKDRCPETPKTGNAKRYLISAIGQGFKW